MAIDSVCDNPTIRDLWHPVAAEAELGVDHEYTTLLLGEGVRYGLAGDGAGWVAAQTGGAELPVLSRYGYLWTSLGEPPPELFDIPEADEADRRLLNAGSIKVATSAPRAVENFLDMGHFPYVHDGLLGAEPHTEVIEYNVTEKDNEIWATDCMFYQPVASASASGGQMTEYTYRVPHPHCVLLYKSVPTDPSRRDVIALFVQAMTQESIRAHNFLCMVDEVSSDNTLKGFQQTIFSQDKPILENQHPKRLPLDRRAETPIRADKVAIAYRRWLRDTGVTYGVVPAA